MTPTPRSLQMRSSLREGISRWSMHASHELMPQLMGILNVCRGLGRRLQHAAEAQATHGTIATIGRGSG